jgi:hypothetical protein
VEFASVNYAGEGVQPKRMKSRTLGTFSAVGRKPAELQKAAGISGHDSRDLYAAIAREGDKLSFIEESVLKDVTYIFAQLWKH